MSPFLSNRGGGGVKIWSTSLLNAPLSYKVLSSRDFCIKNTSWIYPHCFFFFQVCKINWINRDINENLDSFTKMLWKWYTNKLNQTKTRKKSEEIWNRFELYKRNRIFILPSCLSSLATSEVKPKNALHIKSYKNILSKISCSESCFATTLYDYCHFYWPVHLMSYDTHGCTFLK
jgi:hypothetical protein